MKKKIHNPIFNVLNIFFLNINFKINNNNDTNENSINRKAIANRIINYLLSIIFKIHQTSIQNMATAKT